ncbi:MAG: hypothetical protein FIA91_12515 [Geobacter sp.]|nr:hypothetical protein [Geobacter sp.]
MIHRVTVLAVILACGVVFPAGTGFSATVKPLEIFSEKILALEVEHLATEHVLASSRLRKTVDRLNREMNIMSRERARDSLTILDKVAEALAETARSSAKLSGYLTANSVRLKSSGHGRFLPLADMDKESEIPYQQALERVVVTARLLVRHCYDNFEPISNGDKEAGKRYDELFGAYQKDTESFNNMSMARSRYLTDLGADYPSLWELLPR